MGGNIDEGFWQEPTLNVIRSLKQMGGWIKYFARSIETIDNEDIICRRSDPGFLDMLARTRIQEQLEKEVKVCARQFRVEYPDKEINDKELKDKLRVALIKTGWEPDMNTIKQELKELRKQEREELSWLRQEKKRLRLSIRERKQRLRQRKS